MKYCNLLKSYCHYFNKDSIVQLDQNARLSLNTLEYAECLLDSGSHSNLNFTVICNYQGPLDIDLLERALVHVAEIHPLLCKTLDSSNDTFEFIKAKYAVPITLLKYVGGTQSEDVSLKELKESCKRSIFSVIHNTQSVMSDYPKDNFFGVTDGIDRKNTRSRFLETSPRAMARVWIIPGKILSAAVIAPTPV